MNLIIVLFNIFGFLCAEEFSRCDGHADCALALGNCDEIISINKKYLKKNEEIRLKVKPIISCSLFVESIYPEFVSTECINNTCKLRIIKSVHNAK